MREAPQEIEFTRAQLRAQIDSLCAERERLKARANRAEAELRVAQTHIRSAELLLAGEGKP